jgi:hypothetical protein
MDRRIAWAIGITALTAAAATAQPPAGTGYYPAAPGPVMALPSSVLFPDPVGPPGGPGGPGVPGYGEKPPRYPLDENGNRAINWFYSQTDLLFGWTEETSGRPLATTGSIFGRGVIGEPGTTSFGSANDFDTAYGVRQTVGWWFTPQRNIGLEASGFVFERKTSGFSVSSDAAGNPVLARPFVDATTGQENARNIAYPDAFAGNITALASQRVYGADIGFVIGMRERETFNVDLLGGFRFLALIENLDTADYSQALAGGLLAFNGALAGAPAAVGTNDHVSTQNRFYGPSFGVRAAGAWNRVTYQVSTRIGLGWVVQSQATTGTSTFYADGITPTTTTAGGMLIFPQNSGRITRTQFAAVPEFGFKLGYQLTRRMGVYMGYDLVYLSNAVRPSDAVSQPINPTLLPTGQNFGIPFGPISPVGGFNNSDFLLHSITGGIQIVF